MSSAPVKVVFLTYFYPPCSLTAANRVSGWVKHLQGGPIAPVVITRNWDRPIGRERDVALPSGEAVEVKREGSAEIHTVPFRPLLREPVDYRPSVFSDCPLASVALFV